MHDDNKPHHGPSFSFRSSFGGGRAWTTGAKSGRSRCKSCGTMQPDEKNPGKRKMVGQLIKKGACVGDVCVCCVFFEFFSALTTENQSPPSALHHHHDFFSSTCPAARTKLSSATDELRFASISGGESSSAFPGQTFYRHFECVTRQVLDSAIQNMGGDITDIPGENNEGRSSRSQPFPVFFSFLLFCFVFCFSCCQLCLVEECFPGLVLSSTCSGFRARLLLLLLLNPNAPNLRPPRPPSPPAVAPLIVASLLHDHRRQGIRLR